MNERHPTITPREAAKDLIRSSVLRGESRESLRSSSLGAINERYRAIINLNNTIEVVVVGGDGVREQVSLTEVYNDIRREQLDDGLVQAKLL